MKYVVLCAGQLYKPFGTTKIWPSWQGGVREGQNLPQNGLNLALEPSRGPQIGQWTLKWTQMVPPTARDWFESISWPFKALQPLYTKKNINYLILWKVLISEILTFTASTDQTIPFSGDFLIFLSLPHDGWLRKIEISWKKCIDWLVEAVKVTSIFFRILG